MTFKHGAWFPIAVALTVLNLVGLGYAVRMEEPSHALIHVGLTFAFGAWAVRLRRRSAAAAELPFPVEALQELEAEVSQLRQELTEMQERLDFTERVLAQRSEIRRMDPQG